MDVPRKEAHLRIAIGLLQRSEITRVSQKLVRQIANTQSHVDCVEWISILCIDVTHESNDKNMLGRRLVWTISIQL